MSLKFSALWLYLPDPDGAFQTHGAKLERHIERDSLRIVPGSSFAEILLGDPDFAPEEPGGHDPLSALLGEVIRIDVSANVGQIRYARFVNGALGRHLMYNYDCGWSNVCGDPAPWEATVLFGPEAQAELESILADYDDEAYRAKARAIYKSGVVNNDNDFPRVDAISLLNSLTDYYGVRGAR